MFFFFDPIDDNRGLRVGTVITQIIMHPYIKPDGYWAYHNETSRFRIISTGIYEYRIEYEDGHISFWPMWDKQPYYGFWIDRCSPIRFYVKGDEFRRVSPIAHDAMP